MIYHGDCLSLMKGMTSGSVDLIATDPPYNTGRNFGAYQDKGWEVEPHNPFLHEPLTMVAEQQDPALADYLCWLGVRVMEMKRLLTSEGSLYLQCDWRANSYIRVLLDIIFGRENYRNEIAWCYLSPGNPAPYYPRKKDHILWYAKSKASPFNRNAIRIPYKKVGGGGKFSTAGPDDEERVAELRRIGKVPEDWWVDIPMLNSMAKERVDYPTQKPLALYNRIIQASSNEGDLVLDPFCGSGTTLVAAHNLGRRFIGIDLNEEAVDTAKERLG